jgi:hypothetical protein
MDGGEIPALDEPLVVLLGEQGTGARRMPRRARRVQQSVAGTPA